MMAFPLGIPITFCKLWGHHRDGIQICPSDLPRQGILQLGNWKMGKLNCLGLFGNLWYRKKNIESLEHKFNVLHTGTLFLVNTLIGAVVQDPHLLIGVPRNHLYGQFFLTISSELCGPAQCERQGTA